MIRLVVAVSFLIVSLAAVWGAYALGTETNSGAVLVNLGTEIFGILVTIAVVEWFFERKRLQDRARELSWSVLHTLERAVWTWQGGPQQVGTEELLGLIAGIDSKAHITATTRTLMVNVGAKAREAMDKEPRAVKAIPGLKAVLEDLQSLRSLQDGDKTVSVRMVAEILEAAVSGLAGVLGLASQRIPAALIRYRDASEEAQNQRFYSLGQAALPFAPDEEERQHGPGDQTNLV